MSKMPVGIKAAWITVGGGIIVALIGVLAKASQSHQVRQSMDVKNSPGSTNTQVAGDYVVNSPIPRVISDAAKRDMVNILKSAPPGSKIRIDIMGSDNESRKLAEQIQGIFRTSGWNAPPIRRALDQNFEKVSMRVKGAEQYPPRAVQVKQALERAGLGAQVFTDSQLDIDEIQICVGPE